MRNGASRNRPRVSIGLPVRDGERYLEDAIESIRGQTLEDWELLVSDNASTDRTPEICADYAAQDDRIRVARTERNVGAAPNFNRTWHMSRGTYFRWAAHDDFVAPEYLERCVEVLDTDRSVVLCHSKVRVVDSDGQFLHDYVQPLRIDSDRPSERFSDLLLVRNNCYEVFGLIRSEVLARTRLMGNYPVGDRVLLVELTLRGKFHEVPMPLFFSREHDGRSVRRLRTQWERAPWFDPRWEGRITFPEWRTFGEYVRALNAAPIDARERASCSLALLQWLRHYRKRMRRDLAVAAGTMLSRMTPG